MQVEVDALCQEMMALWSNGDKPIKDESQQNQPYPMHSGSKALGMQALLLDESQVLQESQDWIQAIISDFSVCPYTRSANRAGVPIGNICYIISHSLDLSHAHVDYWKAVHLLTQTSDKEVSTVLLIYPYFRHSFSDFTIFTESIDDYFQTSSHNVTSFVDNVYFHPEFRFIDRDDQVVFIFDDNGDILGRSDEIVSPISYARRSPYPIINLLRMEQVQRVQKNMPEGKVFHSNKLRLEAIGGKKLQEMLDKRDWSAMPIISRDVSLQKKIDQVEADAMSLLGAQTAAMLSTIIQDAGREDEEQGIKEALAIWSRSRQGDAKE
jgi:hypothetical protein